MKLVSYRLRVVDESGRLRTVDFSHEVDRDVAFVDGIDQSSWHLVRLAVERGGFAGPTSTDFALKVMGAVYVFVRGDEHLNWKSARSNKPMI